VEEGKKMLRGGVAAPDVAGRTSTVSLQYLVFTSGILHLQHHGCMGFSSQKGFLP
jgi:hypothetical protein